MNKTSLTKGAFYHHFQSKEQIFKEIIATYFRDFTNEDFEGFSKYSLINFIDDHLSYNLKVSADLKKLHDGLSSDNNHYSLIFEALRLLPDFEGKVIQHLQSELKAWTNIIQTAYNSGEIRSKLPALQLAELFINVSDGTAIQLIMASNIDEINVTVAKKWHDLYTLVKD